MIRKSLKNIINSAVNAVYSLSILENINKNDYIKKSNADRFKKNLNHSRSKSINFIDHFIRQQKTFRAKTI